MVASGDGSGRTLLLANGEELLEGAGAGDRWLVVAGTGANVVGASVRRDCAQALEPRARVVVAIVLNDVVLGLGVVDPAVDGQV